MLHSETKQTTIVTRPHGTPLLVRAERVGALTQQMSPADLRLRTRISTFISEGRDDVDLDAASVAVALWRAYNTNAAPMEALRRSTIRRATASVCLADELGLERSEALLLGIAQDVGVAVGVQQHQQYATQLPALLAAPAQLRWDFETCFGLDHGAVSAERLAHWIFDCDLLRAVRQHHHAQRKDSIYAGLARCNEAFADLFVAEDTDSALAAVYDAAAAVGLSTQQTERCIDRIGRLATQLSDVFGEPSLPLASLADLSQRAPDQATLLRSYRRITGQLQLAVAAQRETVDQLERSNDELRQHATTDSLTGLTNRRAFRDALAQAVAQADRNDGSVALLLLDVDHFKQVNDTFGHPAGDRVLKTVAKVLTAAVRRCDTVARYGGEEFAVVMPMTGREGATFAAERIRSAIAASQTSWNGKAIALTVSIGGAAGSQEMSKIIDAADQALYRAKRAGRNRVLWHKS